MFALRQHLGKILSGNKYQTVGTAATQPACLAADSDQ